MAKPIAKRGAAMMAMPEARDTYRTPQRDVFWSPFKGMNTTVPKNFLQRDTLQWAENVCSWYGSCVTRPGVVDVGDASGGLDIGQFLDTFTAAANPEALSAHTPTGGGTAFVWVAGTYTTCPEFYTYNTTAPTNVARLPSTGVWGGNHSLTANVMTNILDPVVTAVDICSTVMDTIYQVNKATVTIPSGMTRDGFVGVLIGANADGSGGYVVTAGYFPSASRQRIAVWSRDSAGVMTLISQVSQASGLFTFDVPFTIAIISDGTTGHADIEFNVTLTTPGYAGIMGCISGDGGTDVLRLDDWSVTQYTAGDITTVVEFTTSDGVSYLLRMGLFGVQVYDGTNWNQVSGYTPPSTMTVYDKYATTSFGDVLIFSDGISGMYKYNPVDGNITQITEAPAAKHLTTVASRVVASYIVDPASNLTLPSRVQWSVKNNSDDWDGIGSGFEDMLSTPGGAIDEQMGVFPLDDYKSLVVRSNSVWMMTASGNVDAPFVFDRRFPGIGSKWRHSIVSVPGGIIGLMNDLSVYFVSESAIEPVGDAIRDPRYSINGSRISRDADFGDLLAVGAFSAKQRKYVLALSTRNAPVDANTGGFNAVMYQLDLSDKSWVCLVWPEASLHWVTFSSGTRTGLTIESSTGNIEDAGTESIESETVDIGLGQRDVLVAAGGRIVYREDYTAYSDDTAEFGANPISQSLVSGQLTAATPVNRVELTGFRLIYMSSVTGDLTLRIHIWDSGAEETVDIPLPIQKSMDSSDAVILGSRMAYAPVRAEGYNIEFEVINELDGRVVVMGAAPEIKGTPDIVAGYGTTAMP